MHSVVGLDIGQEWIKAVEITNNSKITKIGKIKISLDAEQDEDIKQQLYSAKIKELFNNLKLTRDNVIINFRGSYVLARTYLPPVSDKVAFEQWFVNNIEVIIPGTNIEDVIYAYDLLPSGRALIAFARLQQIERLLAMLKECNIIPLMIDASCLALYDAFAFHPWFRLKKNFAILDISYITGDLLIIREGEPFGTGIVSCKTKISSKDGESIKRYTEELNSNLMMIFKYYEKKENMQVNDLIIVGDYAKIPEIRKNLIDAGKYTVESGNPFRYHKFKMPSKYNKENLGYAQALGLALKGLSKSKIDLFPYEKKKEREYFYFKEKIGRSAKRSLVLAFPIMIILVCLLIFINQKNENIIRKITETKEKISALSYVNAHQETVNQKINRLREINQSRIKWSEILYHLGRDVPAGLYLKEISTDIRLVSNGPNTARKIRIVIDGLSENQKGVIDLIKKLENRFKDIAVEEIKGGIQCEFRISLGL